MANQQTADKFGSCIRKNQINMCCVLCIHVFPHAVATKASFVARSLKLRHVDLSTWMGDHQGRLGAVNLDPLVSADFNLRPAVYSRYCANTDVKWIKSNMQMNIWLFVWLQMNITFNTNLDQLELNFMSENAPNVNIQIKAVKIFIEIYEQNIKTIMKCILTWIWLWNEYAAASNIDSRYSEGWQQLEDEHIRCINRSIPLRHVINNNTAVKTDKLQ